MHPGQGAPSGREQAGVGASRSDGTGSGENGRDRCWDPFAEPRVAVLIGAPPPRRLPPGAWLRVARCHQGWAIWVMIALTCFGLFYTGIFTALRAPAVLRLAFALPIVVAAILLVVWLLGLRRKLGLLERGTMVRGTLEALTGPTAALDGLVEVRYRFTDTSGREHSGSGEVVWRDAFASLAPGDAIPVCHDPGQPRRNLSLLLLA